MVRKLGDIIRVHFKMRSQHTDIWVHTWPVPLAPQCTTFFPNLLSIAFACSKLLSGPPTMKVNSASRAATTPANIKRPHVRRTLRASVVKTEYLELFLNYSLVVHVYDCDSKLARDVALHSTDQMGQACCTLYQTTHRRTRVRPCKQHRHRTLFSPCLGQQLDLWWNCR